MSKETLALSKIRIDGDTQPRDKIDQPTVNEYAEAMKGGAEFPLPAVFHDGCDYWLADGFHRFFAVKKNEQTKMDVDVHRGTVADAQDFADGANGTHGLKRSNADKKRAVSRMVKRHDDWSDRRISVHIGVSHVMVADYRKKNQVEGPSTSRQGRDGKTYPSKAPPRPPKPDSGPSKAPERPKDEAGRIIPGKARDALARTEEFRALEREVHEIKRKVLKLAKEPIGHNLNAQTIEKLFREICTAIDWARPYTSCPMNDECTKSCKCCKGQNWIIADVWKNVPKEFRK